MINDILEMFSYSFMVRAFIVGLLISLCASLIGVSLVLRRNSMIGDGLSHVGFGAFAIATIFGFILSAISIVIALVYLILKLIYWDRFVAGMTPVLLAVLVLGSMQLFFIGFLGEYVLSMNKRIMKRPLVIEEERINFVEEDN